MSSIKYILVTADTNGVDYVSSKNEITDKEIELIRPIVKVISDCEGYFNWPTLEFIDETVEDLYKDKLTDEQISFFESYVPYGEYGIYSIQSVEIVTINESLLN